MGVTLDRIGKRIDKEDAEKRSKEDAENDDAKQSRENPTDEKSNDGRIVGLGAKQPRND